MQDDFMGGPPSTRPIERGPCRHCGRQTGEAHEGSCPQAVSLGHPARRYYEIGYESGVQRGRNIPRTMPTTARVYLVVIQDPKGYPQATTAPLDLIEPVARQAVLLEDYQAACERIDTLERDLEDFIERNA